MESETTESARDLELQELFLETAKLIRETPVTPDLDISNDEKLRMYGLYKHVTEGPCGDDKDPPSVFNVVARAKYQAWANCRDLTREQAQMTYVGLAASHDHWLGRTCREKLEQYREARAQKKTDEVQTRETSESVEDIIAGSEPGPTTCPLIDGTSTTTASSPDSSFLTGQSKTCPEAAVDCATLSAPQTLFESFLKKHLGISPLIPRGQLDISYHHLAFAACQCLRPQPFSMRRYCKQEKNISEWWESQSTRTAVPSDRNEESVVVGLSVRSLLDLYLTSKSYPQNAEVIVVPPINVEGMMEVLRFHKLRIVPVDISESSNEISTVGIDLEAVKNAASEKTVAIIIVHPFGMLCSSANDMRSLREYCNTKTLDIIEDCAECYAGFDGEAYLGSHYADISFFSFGTIKTATALGGGIAVLRNAAGTDAEQMRRISYTLYHQQSDMEFLWKIIKCLVVKFVAERPFLYGLLLALCDCIGLDFDKTVSSTTRGFSARVTVHVSQKKRRRSESTEGRPLDATTRRDLMVQIRKRPSTALLSLLNRRLRESQKTARYVRVRIERCQKMTRILETTAPSVIIPRGPCDSTHLNWLYPIIVESPDAVCRILRKHGFDVPRGTSQLGCVSPYATGRDNVCTNTENLFDRILYLPIASRSMSVSEMERMARALALATSSAKDSGSTGRGSIRVCDTCKGPAPFHWRSSCVVGVLFLLDGYFFSGIFLRVLPLTLICLVLMAAHALRFCIADFYIESSQAFAKYSFMLQANPVSSSWVKSKPGSTCVSAMSRSEEIKHGSSINDAVSQSNVAVMMDSLKLPSARMLNPKAQQPDNVDRAVLLTGATGFVGSLLLRHLLLHREPLSIMGGVFVLCRSKRKKSAAVRIQELLDTEMFSFLSAEEKECLVTVVEGDVTLADVGMSADDVDLVCNKMSISHVFHCAASVSFTQSLEEAAVSNISSSLNLQSLTKQLKSKSAKYVHISTAFVHGDKTGTASEPLPEQLHSLHPYDPLELYQSMLETQSYASVAMNELGFPNTYTFSKCICEHLLFRENGVETIIIRPSIVGPSVQEPYEGWGGEKPSTIVAAACLYMSYQWNLWSFGKQRVPFIPVDVVCRFVLAKAFRSRMYERKVPGVETSSSTSSEEDDFERISRWSGSSSFDSEPGSSVCSPQQIASTDGETRFCIYNAAWDMSSPTTASFSWIDYAVAVTQLGSVKGYFNRATAYFGLFLTVKLLPCLNMSLEVYERVHNMLVQMPVKFVLALFGLVPWTPEPVSRLSRLNAFLDLPLLFFPFMNKTFTFESDLVAPENFNGERYMFSCAVAAERFLAEASTKMRYRMRDIEETKSKSFSAPSGLKQERDNSIIVVGGRRHIQPLFDLWWALTQPRGSSFIRMAGWFLIKILRLVASEVTIDFTSFSHLAALTVQCSAGQKGGTHTILVPTHRSLFDFLLLSYVIFALPELGVVMPHIAAAEEFSRLPLLGWFARIARAFFLKRGRGSADPALSDTVRNLKDLQGETGSACIEVFIEGCRSRDRRFISPKTGFLRCLAQTGGVHLLVPIAISYECIPEQATLAYEVQRSSRRELSNRGLLSWLKRVVSRKVNLGRIHISAAPPIRMESITNQNFSEIAREIQIVQQDIVCVSSYHIDAACVLLGLEQETIRKALQSVGCRFWPKAGNCVSYCETITALELARCPSELWTILLQFGHLLAPLFLVSHPKWCQWLNPVQPLSVAQTHNINPDLRTVKYAICKQFDAADDAVDSAIRLLRSKGFTDPNEEHVVQFAGYSDVAVPTLLLRSAVRMRLDESKLSGDSRDYATDIPSEKSGLQRISHSMVKPSWQHTNVSSGNSNKEVIGSWGFRDSGFVLNVSRDGAKSVIMKGNRYDICGKRLKKLVPFIEKETQVRLDPLNISLPVRVEKLPKPESHLRSADVYGLKRIASRVSVEMLDRARNGFGHSQEDIYLLRSGEFSNTRIPDAVVWPLSEDEVEKIVSLAVARDWCLIPCGGGTNVSHSTRCPTREIEPRPIISLDTKLMNRILWVNEEDGLAHVEGGITGCDLVQEMEQRGYTIGHEPDSIEFSTLGGWIATKASGMKQNKYGNIEDIVKAVRVAGSEGILWQNTGTDKTAFGREARGIDLCSLVIGSEGCFGVVTSAIVRIWPLAECREYASVILPDFEHGLRFVRDVARLARNMPASVRLLDNEHFRLGQALHEDHSTLDKVRTNAMKLIARVTQSFSVESMVCATILYEGNSDEVRQQERVIKKLSAVHGGSLAGSKTGRAAYRMTFVIAYLRDFAMSHFLLSESFETFAPWSKVKSIVFATKKRISDEHKKRCLPGVPFVGCRVTQLYHEGACLYFYFCMNFENVNNPSAVFAEIEHCARSEILKKGGSLSHHHGIGKLRAPFLSHMDAEALHDFQLSLKESLDPKNVFGARNGVFGALKQSIS